MWQERKNLFSTLVTCGRQCSALLGSLGLMCSRYARQIHNTLSETVCSGVPKHFK